MMACVDPAVPVCVCMCACVSALGGFELMRISDERRGSS